VGVEGRGRVRRLVRQHPEVWWLAIVVLAWMAVLAPAGLADGSLGVAGHPHGGERSSAVAVHAHPTGGAGDAADEANAEALGVLAGLAGWSLMVVAMMGLAVVPMAHHVGVGSLRWRRQRAVAEALLAYLAVWVAFGVPLVVLARWVAPERSAVALVLVLLVAAGWQLAPGKLRALRRCHRTVPLPPRGWDAERGALRFGWRHGRACLASCWALMAVMAVVSVGHVWWMLAGTAVVVAERVLEHPRRTSRRVGWALVALAVVLGAVTFG
jgi:predicted metal-binding membrane protein